MADGKGFFIRNNTWCDILASFCKNDEFIKDFKHHIRWSYENKINKILHKQKEKDVKKFSIKNPRKCVGMIKLNVQ